MDAKMQQPVRTIENIRKEWKGYNEKAYAREALRWWGKYYDDEDDKDDKSYSGLDEACLNASYIVVTLIRVLASRHNFLS